jgi:hypothetical protein
MKLATIGMMIGMTIGIMMLAAVTGWGQSVKLPDGLEKLGAKAEDRMEVSLDKAMLKLAAHFLSDRGDEAKARKVMAGLESIYVRSFKFSRDGEYNPADLDAFRAVLASPSWSRVVGVRSTRDEGDVDVFLKSGANSQLGGAVVIAAKPRELTIVQITGTLDPDQLAGLGGQFHIPHLAFYGGAR